MHVLDICWNCLTKYIFYGELKQGLSNIPFCSLRILYNSKFILMATSLEANSFVVKRVHCISPSENMSLHAQNHGVDFHHPVHVEGLIRAFFSPITKTRLFKNTENFTSKN